MYKGINGTLNKLKSYLSSHCKYLINYDLI